MILSANTKDVQSIFLDASILVAVIDEDDRAVELINFLFDNYIKVYASILSFMFAYRHSIRRQKKDGVNKNHLVDILESNIIIFDLSARDYSLAKMILKNSDFEDAIQIASCLNAKVDNFVTIDKGLQKLYGDKVNIILVE